MDCPSCADKIENSVKTLNGINEIDPQIATGTLSVSYDNTQTTADAISDRIKKAGYTVENRDEVTLTVTAPEMDCPSCTGKIENALNRISGISAYDTQPTTGKILVTYDSTTVTESEIVTAIESAGYR